MEGRGDSFLQDIRAGNHSFRADEPKTLGGTDKGANPYDYLLAALGACTSMTLRMYAERKQWPPDRVSVRLRHEKIHAQDCEECETVDGKVDRIERDVTIEGDLSVTLTEGDSEAKSEAIVIDEIEVFVEPK